MGRIVVSENITLDGVIQDPGGDEGFEFGGWFARQPEAVREAWAATEYEEAMTTAAWLIGRGSYQWFARRWAARPGAWADRLRELPKYVVSATLTAATEWANSSVLSGDPVESAGRLRREVDGDVLVYASAPLVRALLEHDLVDELRLMTYPVVLGQGERLFGEIDRPLPLRLVEVRAIAGTLTLLTYQPDSARRS